LNLHGSFDRVHGLDLQDSNEPFPRIVFAFSVAPGVAAFGLGMPGDAENLNITLPDRLAFENLMDRHTGNVNG
jgi:hypothetical protein